MPNDLTFSLPLLVLTVITASSGKPNSTVLFSYIQVSSKRSVVKLKSLYVKDFCDS